MSKLKTLKDMKLSHLILRSEPGEDQEKQKYDLERGVEQFKQGLKQEAIKWVKDAQKSWVTGSHTDNSHFVLDMWMKSLDITDEDLK